MLSFVVSFDDSSSLCDETVTGEITLLKRERERERDWRKEEGEAEDKTCHRLEGEKERRKRQHE